jgi:hypothetical protein
MLVDMRQALRRWPSGSRRRGRAMAARTGKTRFGSGARQAEPAGADAAVADMRVPIAAIAKNPAGRWNHGDNFLHQQKHQSARAERRWVG